MQPTLGPVSVRLYDTWLPDGHEMTMCKMTTFGEPPNAMAKLYEWNSDTKNPQFREFDRLIDCTYDEVGERVTIIGRSDRMQEELELPASESIVRWVVDIEGCESCR